VTTRGADTANGSGEVPRDLSPLEEALAAEAEAEAPNTHDVRQDNEEPQAEGPIMVDGLELGAADDSDLDEEEMTAEEENVSYNS
jgi:hypothetical protein